ncbi:unnamed protein product [Prorocentrum cordatum]|uniref:Activator of Hsp90 ATPase N-terminal domain-containing protein n=1 Tax=Prorocentrum cordatum TaxID=2364126 RepID=A0ABN9Q794_9DINO|nr:unnamed protein product [Polarella glacialis]
MAKRFDIHSPAGGAAKQSRTEFPLNTMDGAEADPEVEVVEDTEDQDMKAMMKIEARDEANSAKQTALEAKMTACGVEEDMKRIKKIMITKEWMEEAIRAFGKTTTEEEITRMIQDSLSKMNLGSMRPHPSTHALTSTVVVVGGLKGYSFKAASEWIDKLIKSLEVYKDKEGEEFKGLVFAKFANETGAAEAVKIMREKVMQENVGKEAHERIWCDIEAPIDVRVCTGFLRNFRSQLIEWKFSPECIEIDRPNATLKVQGEEVIKVKVGGGDFQVEWVKEEWAQWQELQSSSEFALVLQTAKDRLAKSRGKTTREAGKGPGK